MIQKITCCIIIQFLHQFIHAQVLVALLFGDKLNSGALEFGLLGGPGAVVIRNFENQSRPVFDVGLYFNIRINDNLYLHPEAIPKSTFGGRHIAVYPTGDPRINELFEGGTVTRKIKAISVPLLARYRLSRKLFLDMGPQIDLLYGASDKFTVTASDGNDVNYKNSVSDEYNWFALSIAGGLAWRFKDKPFSMSMSFRYLYGLTDIQRSAAGTQTNNGPFFFIYIPIGSSKAAKKQAAEKHDP